MNFHYKKQKLIFIQKQQNTINTLKEHQKGENQDINWIMKQAKQMITKILQILLKLRKKENFQYQFEMIQELKKISLNSKELQPTIF